MQYALPTTFKMSHANIIFIGKNASLVVRNMAAPALYIAMNGMEMATIIRYISALAHTSDSICPKRIPIKKDLANKTINMKIIDEMAENHIN